jgi:hypothetical protein
MLFTWAALSLRAYVNSIQQDEDAGFHLICRTFHNGLISTLLSVPSLNDVL